MLIQQSPKVGGGLGTGDRGGSTHAAVMAGRAPVPRWCALPH
jgi:hypothetical protein